MADSFLKYEVEVLKFWKRSWWNHQNGLPRKANFSTYLQINSSDFKLMALELPELSKKWIMEESGVNHHLQNILDEVKFPGEITHYGENIILCLLKGFCY